MRHVAVVVIIAGLGLAGCGGFHMQTATDCDGRGICWVEVNVDKCIVTATPDVLRVTGKRLDITWKLDAFSSKYQFRPNDGVALKTPNDEFEPRPTGNSDKFMVHDKNSLPPPPIERPYPYRINVQKKVSGGWDDCPSMDPTIVNQG